MDLFRSLSKNGAIALCLSSLSGPSVSGLLAQDTSPTRQSATLRLGSIDGLTPKIGNLLAIENLVPELTKVTQVSPSFPISAALNQKLESGELGVQLLNVGGAQAQFSIVHKVEGAVIRIGESIQLDKAQADYLVVRDKKLIEQLEIHAEAPPEIVSRNGQPIMVVDAIRSPVAHRLLSEKRMTLEASLVPGVNSMALVQYRLGEQKDCKRFVPFQDGKSVSLEQLFDPEFKPGLSHLLTQGDRFKLTYSSDLSNYYCAHALYSSTQFALYDKESLIFIDTHGHPLVTFLHVPSDKYSVTPRPNRSPEALLERHQSLLDAVVSITSAFLVYAKDSVPKKERLAGRSEIRILITGFGTYSGVSDNSTGEFARSKSVMEELIKRVGGGLIDSSEQITPDRCKVTGKINHPMTPQLSFYGAELPVSDRAIDGGTNSLQSLLREIKPQIVITMGQDHRYRSNDVCPTIFAHPAVTNQGLKHEGQGFSHSGKFTWTLELPVNHSLFHAFQQTGGITPIGAIP